MMTPFLQQVARYYLDAQGLEDYCFVFPNRRGGQFFTHYLQQELLAADKRKGNPRPHLMPNVTSISELVAQLTGTVAATDIEMVFALYDAYCRAMGDSAQEFDKFIYWAQLIINDFNDIDRSMADAASIYQNLEDLHQLNSNYLSSEVKEKVRRIFGDNLFTAFFDTDTDADLWRHIQERIGMAPSDGEQGPNDTQGFVKQQFLTLWNRLATIYGYYHETLNGKEVVSPGMQLRLAAEQSVEQMRYSRMVFVGFGVLSVAECSLFAGFKSSDKADFWWDNAGIAAQLEKAPNDPGALLIDGYCQRFGAMPVEPIDNAGQTVRVVAVPSTVGQAKQAFNEVVLIKEREERTSGKTALGIETAIVLPDEGLLVPLLHSIHAPYHDGGLDLNVTLGYPLRSSGIVSLMHIVARMHHQASKDGKLWTYYREDVNDILSHPLIKTYFTAEALELATELARTNRFRVPAHEFEPYGFSDLFAPAMDSDLHEDVIVGQMDYLDRLMAFCNRLMAMMMPAVKEATGPDEDFDNDSDGDEVPLQQAFLLMYTDVLNQLKRSFAECSQPLRQQLQRGTVFFLIDRLAASAIVPFTGEPLRGLQIMGLLETRSLDFDNVVILSMNERIFPRRRSINSFIPNYMRRAHGMSTIEQQEAIVSYNFFRLLNRSSQVTLIYDSSAQKMGSSEPSRYITQLEMVYGKRLQYVDMSLHVETSAAISIQVPPDDKATLRTRYTSDPAKGGRCLSASAINKYINCPLMFYMHYVQGLNDDSDTGDFMDYSTFGRIIHDTLSDCYGGDSQRLVDADYIKQYKKEKLEPAVIRNIKKTYLHVPEDELDHDTGQLRGEAFMLIDTISSYVKFVLDYDLELIASQGPFTVLECEREHRLMPMMMDDVPFNFTYTPDRVDILQDGMVRIVDYKTGSDVTSFSPAAGLPDLFNPTNAKRRKAILQLFLYCYAYMTEHPDEDKVMPVIYKLPSMKESGVMCKGSGRGAAASQFVFEKDNVVVREFISQMASTIKSLYDEAFDQADEGSKSCNYCRFIDFCRRTPSKAW